MKILPVALLASFGFMATGVHAQPAQAMLEWHGFTGGVFNSSEIALTGQGGGDILRGVLQVQEDGTFTTTRPVVVEAHATKEEVPGSGVFIADTEFFDGDVKWTLSNQFVDSQSTEYDAAQLTFTLNGDVLAADDSITTSVGDHSLSVGVSYDVPLTEQLAPGSHVAIAATIFAQPDVGIIP